MDQPTIQNPATPTKELTNKEKTNELTDHNDRKSTIRSIENFTQNDLITPNSQQRQLEYKRSISQKTPEDVKIPDYIKQEVQQMNFDALREKSTAKPIKYTPKIEKHVRFKMDYEDL